MSNSKLTLIILATMIAAAVVWVALRTQSSDPQPVTMPDDRIAEQPPAAVEKYPVPSISAPNAADLVELPKLVDSDGYFKLELKNLFGSGIESLLRESGGVERFVATIDNLPRRRFAERLRLLEGPTGAVQVSGTSADEQRLDESNYARYTPYLRLLESADTDQIVGAYRRFYPLMQEAYVDLGYPDGFFNDRMVAVIDHLLETPVPDDTPELVRPHVLYEFKDPALEKLSAGQKILIRMGPQNAAEVKDRLRDIRARIVNLD